MIKLTCNNYKFENDDVSFSIIDRATKSGTVSMSSEMHQITQVIGGKKEALLISHVREMNKVIRWTGVESIYGYCVDHQLCAVNDRAFALWCILDVANELV